MKTESTNWMAVAEDLLQRLSEHDTGANPWGELVDKYTEEVELEPLDHMVNLMQENQRLQDQQARSLQTYAGMLHADLETLMYCVMFAVPPLIMQADLPDEDKAMQVARVMELADVHRAQLREITGAPDPNGPNAKKEDPRPRHSGR